MTRRLARSKFAFALAWEIPTSREEGPDLLSANTTVVRIPGPDPTRINPSAEIALGKAERKDALTMIEKPINRL